ncbi:2-amino-4-hydroxy-6-hydroxymethyldihydropteridine diphosphokinase [Actinomyces howellii]|uniref:Bifunctional folate synthesis protein n=1 Tax=Actinomyces howellii TaxID=52771 RepID=A0A448HGG2_9ACTO|nr:2-amino-4-hydroxy-6-hydroxymethyldihydropteridine diphosphokinase [Actinomyces howellii]VEG27926.1 Probable dihydroneopterin aldolase [Actinomyces howellii]
MSTNPTTDRIRLTGLSARGYHGALPFERTEGQLFVADVTLDLGERGTAVAAVTDTLSDAVDYGQVARAVVSVIEGEPVNLLETLAERIGEAALGFPRVVSVEVSVHKPQAPLDIAFDDVIVTISRTAETVVPEAGRTGLKAPAPVAAPLDLPPSPTTSQPSTSPEAAAWASSAESAGSASSAGSLTSHAASPAAPSGFTSHAASPAAPSGFTSHAASPAAPSGFTSHAASPAAPSGFTSHASSPAAPSTPSPASQAGPSFGQQASPAVPASPEAPASSPFGESGTYSQSWDSASATSAPAAPVSPAVAASAPSTPAVGQAPSFGQDPAPSAPAFGQAPSVEQAPAFGQDQSAPGFGQPGVPDAPASPAVAASAPSTPAFGQAPSVEQAPAFGQDQSAPGFGQPGVPAAPASPAVAASAPSTSAPSTSAFGQAPSLGQPPAPAPVPEPPAPVDPAIQRPASPVEVVIALGGNVGGVVAALRGAVGTLRETQGLTVTSVAPLARTAAAIDDGVPEQPDFLNTVVLATTTLSPREVLAVCQGLEADAGRVRTGPQGPRTLDADLITYEGVTLDTPELVLPHPRAAQRAFVLVPWAEADPFAEIGSQSVSALAEEAPDRDGVRWLALDWMDSDNLPALPTGQYVEPPVGEPVSVSAAPQPAAAPAQPAAPAVPDQPPAADPLGGAMGAGLVEQQPFAPSAPVDVAAVPSPAAPAQSLDQAAPMDAAAVPVPSYDQPAAPSYDQPAAPSYEQPAAPSYEQPAVPSYEQPAPAQPATSSAPPASDDAPWKAQLNWNDIVGRQGQGS